MKALIEFVYCLLIFYKMNQCLAARKINISTFTTDYCDVKCKDGDKVHTMCPIEKCSCTYSDFALYTIYDGKKFENPFKILEKGHNGIRDRVAYKMNIPNMLHLMWDNKLARMAENFLCRCNGKANDPCTMFDVVFDEKEDINEFYKYKISYEYIVQNTYNEKGKYFPRYFYERAIREWYFDKEAMHAPVEIGKHGEQISKIEGENNFTHLIYPFIYKFGCAVARYDGIFHLVCNYFPFYRTSTNAMDFETGEPGSKCPARFPLHHFLYEDLCTDVSPDRKGEYDDATKLFIDFQRILFIFLLYCTLRSFL